MVLASDNLTYLPTPQLTTREQPFHTKHLPASYISRPYTGPVTLDHQRATAGDPTVLKDFFIKVCSFHVSGYCDHEG
jgi:hypothetical protein